jgi:HNH endonuclease
MELTYHPHTGLFFKGTRRVGSIKGTKEGYVRIRFRGKVLRAHRVAWFLSYGYWPKEIDHINGKVDDNRLINLREGTHEDNMQNRNIQGNNNSGVLGIWYEPDKKRWRAAITVHGKRMWLGIFKTKDEATAARQQAERIAPLRRDWCPVRAPCRGLEPSG